MSPYRGRNILPRCIGEECMSFPHRIDDLDGGGSGRTKTETEIETEMAVAVVV
jgi:hypothetical protein